MERILKLFGIFLLMFVGLSASSAEQVIVKPISATSNLTQTVNVQKVTTTPQNVSPTVPQMISFEKCTKKYDVSVDKLFFMSLASINANKFLIDEIQSANGYILFRVSNRQFLATVARVDPKSSIVKVVPADNNYFFPIGVLTNFFKYIDLNITTAIENLG